MKYLNRIGRCLLAAGILTLLFRSTLSLEPPYLFLWWFFVFLLFDLSISGFQKLFELKYPKLRTVGVPVGVVFSAVIIWIIGSWVFRTK
ncbi:MAG TPA: hypothetical protein HA302_04310 [Thermococcaceae archaeon]|uniref:hypothetical protein n=1 Tax=Thermococcus sibiricus TaxID=172049 RepID=UPI00076D0629|nr:hypothetical protein [Thermococcus sibiricus]KUK27846.1 MAG: Uncharacterized protein XD61_1607 [Thermococcus sp. 40_45]HII67223.1 hypothetical protein [Thermococcaceae archaeon]